MSWTTASISGFLRTELLKQFSEYCKDRRLKPIEPAPEVVVVPVVNFKRNQRLPKPSVSWIEWLLSDTVLEWGDVSAGDLRCELHIGFVDPISNKKGNEPLMIYFRRQYSRREPNSGWTESQRGSQGVGAFAAMLLRAILGWKGKGLPILLQHPETYAQLLVILSAGVESVYQMGWWPSVGDVRGALEHWRAEFCDPHQASGTGVEGSDDAAGVHVSWIGLPWDETLPLYRRLDNPGELARDHLCDFPFYSPRDSWSEIRFIRENLRLDYYGRRR